MGRADIETDPADRSDGARASPAAFDLQEVKKYLRRLGPVGPLAVLAASLPAIGGFILLGSMKLTGPWLRAQGEWGLVIYVSAFALLAGLAILPTYAQAVVGGFAFGLWRGIPAAVGGFAGAAMIGYLIARLAARDRVVQIIAEQPKWKAVYDALVGGRAARTLGIVTLLRIPPNSPFAITNLVLAATKVHPVVFLLGTVLGMWPRTAAAVFIGHGLQSMEFDNPYSRWMWIANLVTALLIVGVIGVIANRAIAKVTAQPKP